MRNLPVIAVSCVVGLAGATSAQQADVLKAAADALGASDVRTLQFTGAGASFYLGQNYTPNDPWPRVTVKSYAAQFNYETASMRVELVQENGSIWPIGGSNGPFMGERRFIQVVSGNDAWNVPAPRPGTSGGPPPAQPQPAAALERKLALWATPHGFVKAALANRATTRNVPGGTEVSFTVDGKYKMTGIINPHHEVDRVRTWIDYPPAGDLLVETVYSVYRDFDGVLFPARIVESRGGYPTLDLRITRVETNLPVEITVPENVPGAQPAPVRVDAKPLAEGVYFLTGGANSVAIEMKDHIVLVDAPANEARGLAVIAKAKELIPNKPVRFLVASHHHWDHTGGIRAAMDEGATIVAHENARAFFERVATMPHTLVPDRLSNSKKTVKVQGVGDGGLRFTDGDRTIELHVLIRSEHAGTLLAVYLPKERILTAADGFDPPNPPGSSLAPVEWQKAKALYDTIRRLKLDPQTLVSMHGSRTADVAELTKSLGNGPASN